MDPRAQLLGRLAAGEATVAGVLSGTSGDGIDVALVRPRAGGGVDALAFETRPFPDPLRPRVRAALDGEVLDARALALLDRDLGRAFGAAAADAARDHGSDLDLVGSHGQTVWHHDAVEASGPATLQLGDGDEVATAAGAPCVADFRRKDVAAGGEGAPLVALVDGELFPDEARPLAVLNLGGMANLTALGPAGEPLAFDTGPAGSLLDGLARRLLDRPLDPGGETAAAGRVDRDWVAAQLDHPFFRRPAPKSTGRDTFGEAYVDRILERGAGRSPADLLASAAELVAATVDLGLALLGPDLAPGPGSRLLLAGGGVHHGVLVRALTERAGARGWTAVSSAEAGVDPDAREALAFALLAVRAVRGQPSTHPRATGAASGAVLGKFSSFP